MRQESMALRGVPFSKGESRTCPVTINYAVCKSCENKGL